MSTIRKLNINIIFGGTLLFSSVCANSAAAEDFSAEKVLKEMNNQQQVAYMAGIIEGLAIARYHKDEKNKDGMGCIYDWFYKEKQNMKLVLDAFEKYPSYPPGSIMDVLVKRKCGS